MLSSVGVGFSRHSCTWLAGVSAGLVELRSVDVRSLIIIVELMKNRDGCYETSFRLSNPNGFWDVSINHVRKELGQPGSWNDNKNQTHKYSSKSQLLLRSKQASKGGMVLGDWFVVYVNGEIVFEDSLVQRESEVFSIDPSRANAPLGCPVCACGSGWVKFR